MGEYVNACGALPTAASGYVYICNWWKCAFAHADAKRVCLSAEIEHPDIVIAVLDDVNAAEGDYFAFGDEYPYDIPAYETGESYDPPRAGYAYVTLFFDRTPEWEYNITCRCAEYKYLCEEEEEPTPQPPPPEPGPVANVFTAIALLFESIYQRFDSLADSAESIPGVGDSIAFGFRSIGNRFFEAAYHIDEAGSWIDRIQTAVNNVGSDIASVASKLSAVETLVHRVYADLYNAVHSIMYPELIKLNDLFFNFGVKVRDVILGTLFDFRFGAVTVQKTLTGFLGESWELIIQLYNNFSAYVLEAIEEWTPEQWGWFSQKLKEGWGIPTSLEELRVYVESVVKMLVGWVPGSLAELKQMLDLGTWLEDVKDKIVEIVTASIGTVIDAALKWVDEHVDKYKDKLWDLAEKLIKKI